MRALLYLAIGSLVVACAHEERRPASAPVGRTETTSGHVARPYDDAQPGYGISDMDGWESPAVRGEMVTHGSAASPPTSRSPSGPPR
jgi:hypothetical protein